MRKQAAPGVMEPFIDLMATLSIVFFIIILISLGTILIQSQTYSQIMQENERLTQIVNSQGYDNLERENLQLKKTNEELKDKYEQVSRDMAKLAEASQQIVEERNRLYDEVTQSLNNALGKNAVERQGTKIIIAADSYYRSGASDMDVKARQKAMKIGSALADTIDKYNKDKDNLVRIAYIEVTGHTDNAPDLHGSYAINDRLGAERAYNFVSVMLDGVTANEKRSRMVYGKYFKAASMSMYQPIAGTVEVRQTLKQQAKNRRIEINIIFTDDDLSSLLTKYSTK